MQEEKVVFSSSDIYISQVRTWLSLMDEEFPENETISTQLKTYYASYTDIFIAYQQAKLSITLSTFLRQTRSYANSHY